LRQKYQIGFIFEPLGIEKVGIFNGYFDYSTAIWYILRPFGKFSFHLVYFSVLVCFNKKSGNPGARIQQTEKTSGVQVEKLEHMSFSPVLPPLCTRVPTPVCLVSYHIF
jgi:hypothetical protein